MNDDFELDESFDFDDEDFAEEIADLEDSIDDAPDVMLRTAILQKTE